MSGRKIAELPYSDELPKDSEVLLPIFQTQNGNPTEPIRQITFSSLINAIKIELEKGCEITVMEDEKRLIRFKLLKR